MPYTIEPKQGRPGCAYTRTPGRDQGRQARPPEPELSPYRSKGTREPGNQGTRGCAYTIEARPEAYQVCPGLGCRLWSLYSYRSKPGCALYQGRKAGKARKAVPIPGTQGRQGHRTQGLQGRQGIRCAQGRKAGCAGRAKLDHRHVVP